MIWALLVSTLSLARDKDRHSEKQSSEEIPAC